MKKIGILFPLLLVIPLLSGCDNKVTSISFEHAAYTIKSGEAVTLEKKHKGTTYEIIDGDATNINLDTTSGVFTFDSSIPNYTQVLYTARYEDLIAEPITVTLVHDYQTANITFNNLSEYVVDGEFVTARASLPYAITYSLKNEIPGISIDSSSGKVRFGKIVEDNTSFTVLAKTHNNAVSEKTFITLTKNFAKVKDNRQVIEKGSVAQAIYDLDFSECSQLNNQAILGLTDELNNLVDPSNYVFDLKKNQLRINSDYINTLFEGSNAFKIITKRNSVAINLEVATRFIYDVEDLLYISENESSLSGYYILMNDIDLSDYFLTEEGNNENKYWTPIGSYNDTIDINVATRFAFKGTFDGDGHTIYNLKCTRKDVHSFNAGLFGYVTSSSVIKNLGVTGYMEVSSFSGGLVGSNNGLVENCWADVDVLVLSGEEKPVYKNVGGLVGSNGGTIKNSFAYGKVECDEKFGALVGENRGEIINCFATSEGAENLIGFGLKASNSQLFSSISELKTYDYSGILPFQEWHYEVGMLPTLHSTISFSSISEIHFTKALQEGLFFPVEVVDLAVEIFPRNLQAQYESLVTYKLIDGGDASLSSNKLDLRGVTTKKVTVEAELHINEVIVKDVMTFELGVMVDTIELEKIASLKSGYSYPIKYSKTPENADEPIIIDFDGTAPEGCSIEDNILTISEECQVNTISLKAHSVKGNVTSTLNEISIENLTLTGNVAVYEDDTNVVLPTNVTPNKVVAVKDKTIIDLDFTFTTSGVSVSKNDLEDIKGQDFSFYLEGDGNRELIYSHYFDHVRYTKEYVLNTYQDAIEINSKEDLFKYFNMENSSSSYSEEKHLNYDKVFYLTSDIDFAGLEILGVGASYDGDEDRSFKGKFFGLGHKISNYVINASEKEFSSDSGAKQYGLALFASNSGEIYDLNVEEMKVTGRNFVGGLVGILKGGLVENCTSKFAASNAITASGYITSADGVFVSGLVGRAFAGQLIGCYTNLLRKNIVG